MYEKESLSLTVIDSTDDIERPDCIRPNGDPCEYYTDIKILPPGATEYVDIKYNNTGNDYTSLKSNVIIDGVPARPYSYSETQEVRDQTYACVADVTTLFDHLQTEGKNTEGLWTVANVRAVTGLKTTGSGGGWSLVVVYEDPLANVYKNISMFEGYVAITQLAPTLVSTSLDFNISGFKTDAIGPVDVDLAVISLEGDDGIFGDQFQINEPNDDGTPSENWVAMSYPGKDANNFFEGSIYSKGNITRYPNSSNTLGYDSSHFSLDNENKYIGNSDTSADFRLYTEGDAFASFFTAFAIETITSEIIIFKEALNADGTKITENNEVDLGQTLNYKTTIINIGNDDVVNIEFTDTLPINTNFTNNEISLNGEVIPTTEITISDISIIDHLTGLTYNTKQLRFLISDELLEVGEEIIIEYSLNIVEDCNSLQNVCSNQLQNKTDITYFDAATNESFSKTGLNTILLSTQYCSNIPSTNETVTNCEDFATLIVNGSEDFENFEWYYSSVSFEDLGTKITLNADGSSIISTDGTINVNENGYYTSIAEKSENCEFFNSDTAYFYFEVELTETLIENIDPFENITDEFKSELLCTETNTSEITEISLCAVDRTLGSNDFPTGTSLSWQQLNTSANCTQIDNCTYNNDSVVSCYEEFSTESTYSFDNAGDYKLIITSPGGCLFDYYFKTISCTTVNPTTGELEGKLIPFTQIYPTANDPSLIKGDIKVIGNSILGIEGRVAEGIDNTNYTPNDEYNGLARNNGTPRGYIDIDSDVNFNSLFNEGFLNSERTYSGSINTYGSPTNSNLADTGTFSSSAAELLLSDSSSLADTNSKKVVKAFLYWGAMYEKESLDPIGTDLDIERPDCTRPNGDPCEHYTDIKILPPGATEYVNIKYNNTGNDYTSLKSNVIIDGVPARPYSYSKTQEVRDQTYACVADVTALFEHLQTEEQNTEGLWTVANVRAVTGLKNTGSGGGWSLVVLYEDPLANVYKNISMFEGYVAISQPANSPPSSLDFNISGFETNAAGPVNVDLAVISLEGDIGIFGDQFQINDPNDDGTLSENWVAMSYPGKEAFNFFDSSIYSKGNITRYPNSSNTLGYDSNHFSLDNNENKYIGNSDTSADFRLYTEGDAFASFFTAFAIETIVAEITISKDIFFVDGTKITENDEADLGQTLNYRTTILNNSNDDAVNIEFTDTFPINTDFINNEIILNGEVIPSTEITISDVNEIDSLTGLTYNTKQLRFLISDELLEIGKEIIIEYSLNIAEDCNALQDLCTNQLQNTTNVTYSGLINNDSFSTTGLSTIVLSTQYCSNIPPVNETITICEDFATLIVNGSEEFENFEWYYSSVSFEDAGTRITVNADESFITSTDETINVNQSGYYTSIAKKTENCEFLNSDIAYYYFEVELAETLIENIDPFENITDEFKSELLCENDGTSVTEFLLCEVQTLGRNDYPEGTTATWQQLNSSANCTQIGDCPYSANTGTQCYDEFATTNTYNFNSAGDYKLTLTSDGGCTYDYYFKISNCPTLSTSTNQISNDQFSFYPSPVKDILTIDSKNVDLVENIKIYNLNGKLLMGTSKTENTTALDLSKLNTGMYIIIISNDKGQIINKVLKE